MAQLTVIAGQSIIGCWVAACPSDLPATPDVNPVTVVLSPAVDSSLLGKFWHEAVTSEHLSHQCKLVVCLLKTKVPPPTNL
jgi:hypothetical protein